MKNKTEDLKLLQTINLMFLLYPKDKEKIIRDVMNFIKTKIAETKVSTTARVLEILQGSYAASINEFDEKVERIKELVKEDYAQENN